MLSRSSGWASHAENAAAVVRGALTSGAGLPPPSSGTTASAPTTTSPTAPAARPARLPSRRFDGRGDFPGPEGSTGDSSAGTTGSGRSGASSTRCCGMNACVSYEAATDRSSRINSSGEGRSSGSLARHRSTSGTSASGTPVRSGSSCTTW